MRIDLDLGQVLGVKDGQCNGRCDDVDDEILGNGRVGEAGRQHIFDSVLYFLGDL
jgi:hypothetical protein